MEIARITRGVRGRLELGAIGELIGLNFGKRCKCGLNFAIY
jgi:hypothetical protein